MENPSKIHTKNINCILLFLSLLIFLAPGHLFPQEISNSVTCAGGETFTAQDYLLDFVIGEPIIESYTVENKILTQGFLQEKLGPTSIGELSDDGIKIKLYPNPASDYLTIDCQNFKDHFWYEIINTTGTSSGKIACDNFPERLDIGYLKTGIYLIRISVSEYDQFSAIVIKK